MVIKLETCEGRDEVKSEYAIESDEIYAVFCKLKPVGCA